MIHFNKGETIHMEDSHKEQIKTLLNNADFQDEHQWINIILARIF